jgi:4'-phosphopantetheinyl transferase
MTPTSEAAPAGAGGRGGSSPSAALERWGPGPLQPRLETGVVHLWRASLHAPGGALAESLALLSGDERTRAARFRSELHRRRYIVGRAVQRRLLARYLAIPPELVVYRLGPHGKPALDAAVHPGGIRFNVSNSEDDLLLALALGAEVGVDLEALRPVTERDAIAARFFSAPEQEVYRSLPEAQRDAAFYACWTRKEAWIKALGDGLTLPLDRFDVTLRPGEPARLLATRGDPGAAARWTLREVDVGAGWLAALAVEGPVEGVRLYEWPGEERCADDGPAGAGGVGTSG